MENPCARSCFATHSSAARSAERRCGDAKRRRHLRIETRNGVPIRHEPQDIRSRRRCGARLGSPSNRPAQRPVTAKSHSAAHVSLMGRENRHGSGQGTVFTGASLRYESARNLRRPGAVSSKVERRINSPIWLVLARGVHSVQGRHSIQLGGRESTEPGSIRQKKSAWGANPAILRRRHEGFVIAVR
jgi:hypothetical protein